MYRGGWLGKNTNFTLQTSNCVQKVKPVLVHDAEFLCKLQHVDMLA